MPEALPVPAARALSTRRELCPLVEKVSDQIELWRQQDDGGESAGALADRIGALLRQQGQAVPDAGKMATEASLADAIVDALSPTVRYGLRNVIHIIDAAALLAQQGFLRTEVPANLMQCMLLIALQSEIDDHAEEIVRSLEQNAGALAALSSQIARLHITRASVLFLRRLSMGNRHALAGRIRTVLSVPPFSDKSGVNLKGHYNEENVIQLASLEEFERHHIGDQTHLNDGENSVSSSRAADYALYCAFWGVQTSVAHPPSLQSEAGWVRFANSLDTVLAAFETLGVEGPQSETNPANLYPSYLTSPMLLRLQLVDRDIRRSVLTQYSIVLQHLRLVSMDYAKDAEAGAFASRDMAYVATLFSRTGKQGRADAFEHRISRLLRDLDGDSPKGFVHFLHSALDQEVAWVRWKSHTQCSQRPADHDFDDLDKIRRVPARARPKRDYTLPPQSTSSAARPTFVSDGQLDVTPLKRMRYSDSSESGIFSKRARLQSGPEGHNWACLSSAERKQELLEAASMMRVPTVDDYRSKLQQDEEDNTEPVFRKHNDPSYTWRCMRTICLKSCETFCFIADPLVKSSVPAFDVRRLLVGSTERADETSLKHGEGLRLIEAAGPNEVSTPKEESMLDKASHPRETSMPGEASQPTEASQLNDVNLLKEPTEPNAETEPNEGTEPKEPIEPNGVAQSNETAHPNDANERSDAKQLSSANEYSAGNGPGKVFTPSEHPAEQDA